LQVIIVLLSDSEDANLTNYANCYLAVQNSMYCPALLCDPACHSIAPKSHYYFTNRVKVYAELLETFIYYLHFIRGCTNWKGNWNITKTFSFFLCVPRLHRC